MLLGRNTIQWTALIGALIAVVSTSISVAFPDQVAAATIILTSVGAALNVFIAFLADTQTTPIMDPRLQVGTVVQATDPTTGVVVGHVKVPEPEPAPVVPNLGPEGHADPDHEADKPEN
jgi:hypothetical protein